MIDLVDPAAWAGGGGLGARLVQHLGISALALLVATVVALPTGLVLGHLNRFGFLAINLGNVGRAVPTYALLVLFVLLPAPLGANTHSFVLGLALFSVPPILTNAFTGVREADRSAVDAGRGLGMSGPQLLLRVELPLATPLVLAGMRLAAVQVVATTTVIGLVGGEALGRTINTGFVQQDQDAVLSAAVLVAALALAVELLMGGLERLTTRRRSRPRPGPGDGRETDDVDPDAEMAAQVSKPGGAGGF